MKSMKHFGLLAVCIALLPACSGQDDAVAATPAAATPPPIDARPPSREKFMDLMADLEAFAGDAKVELPGEDPAGPVAVAERLTRGFQQDPPRRLALEDGSTIYWGWQEGQAFIRSIAIYDADGELRLAGAVESLPNLRPRSGDPIASEAAYQQLLDKQEGWGSPPSVTLFAKDQQALDNWYPLARRWTQAAMLGFKAADCAGGQGPAVCGFVTQASVPTAAYSVDCPGELVNACPLTVPGVEAAAVPLQDFRQ